MSRRQRNRGQAAEDRIARAVVRMLQGHEPLQDGQGSDLATRGALDSASYDATPRQAAYDQAVALAAQADALKKLTPPTGEIQDLPVNVVSAWNAESIRGAVNDHVLGQFARGSLLTEACMGDDRVQSAINGRTKAIVKSDTTFEPSKTADGRKARKVAKDVEDAWPEILPETILEQLIQWYVFSGFVLFEILWKAHNDKWLPELKLWHPLYIYYRIDIRKYVALTLDGPIEIEPNDPKWFLFTPFGSYRGWMRGAVRSVAIPWIVRQFALRDWARYSEKHGLPITKAKVPAQSSVEDKRRFFNGIKRLGSESTFLLPVPMGANMGEWDVDLLEAKADTWEAFKGLRGACDESITLSIRGTNLTTQVSGGSFAAAKTHREEDSDFAESDSRKIARSMKHQVLSLYALYNYGDANLAPTPKIESAPDEDKKTEAETMGTVATAIQTLEAQGWPIDRQAVAEKFEIPLLEGVDPGTYQPPAPPTAPGAAPGEPAKDPAAAPKAEPDDTETDLPEGQ